jgi:hypothetical protein
MASKQNKNPELAERSNAEKWVVYLSAFDFSALRIGFICSPSIDPSKRLVISPQQNTLLPSSALAERTNYDRGVQFLRISAASLVLIACMAAADDSIVFP